MLSTEPCRIPTCFGHFGMLIPTLRYVSIFEAGERDRGGESGQYQKRPFLLLLLGTYTLTG